MNQEIKTFNISEASQKISQDLQLPVTESRIRKYEADGLITPQRNEDKKYRIPQRLMREK